MVLFWPFDTEKGDAVLYSFDFEMKTEVDTRVFIPYCVVEKVCKKFKRYPSRKMNGGFVKDLDCCGKRQFVFEGNDTIGNFC